MATFRIPNQGQIRQTGRGDVFGELWASRNVDLSESPGKLKLARPMKRVATDSTIGSDSIVGLGVLNGSAYALTPGTLYRATGASGYETWASESTTPDRAEDMVVFRGQLVMTTTDDLDAYDGSSFTSNWWTARGNPSLTSNNPVVAVPHIMEVVRIGAETLAVTDGNEVHAYTGAIGSGSGTSVTVDLDKSAVASCIKSAIRKVWIGTYNKAGQEAHVYEWDGASTNYTQSFPVGAQAVLAMELVDDIPYIVTELGEVRRFNGVGFTTVASFPFATSPVFDGSAVSGSTQSNSLVRPVHPKGMKRQGGTLFIYATFRGPSDLPLDSRSLPGIWALDLATNSLTHRASPEGGLLERVSPIMLISSQHGRIMCGGRDTSGENGIFLEDLGATANRGYAITTEFGSEAMQDSWHGMGISADVGGGSVRVKYRTERVDGYPVTITGAWSSTSVIGSTDADLALVKTRYDAGYRDEVEVIDGGGAGKLAHISKVEKSASTYTVTLDEAIGVAGETVTFYVDNWKASGKVQESTFEKHGTAGEASSFAQYKVELRGDTGNPTIREMTATSSRKDNG